MKKTVLKKLNLQWFQSASPLFVFICLFILIGFLRPALGKEKTILLGFRQGEDSEFPPEGWELLTYPATAENEFSLTQEDESMVLHVKSLGSASGLLKTLNVNLEEFPLLVWRWKINRVVGMAVENQKDRNDSTARIRVIFGKRVEKPPPVSPQIEELLKSLGIESTAREPSGFKIDYIWGNRLPLGKVLDSPSSRNHKIVFVETGNEMANRWIWEERNLVEDYERLFMAAPPGLSAIVVLTDTEDTNEGVEAWYSSIVLMGE